MKKPLYIDYFPCFYPISTVFHKFLTFFWRMVTAKANFFLAMFKLIIMNYLHLIITLSNVKFFFQDTFKERKNSIFYPKIWIKYTHFSLITILLLIIDNNIESKKNRMHWEESAYLISIKSNKIRQSYQGPKFAKEWVKI